ncbi:hypothetical protein DMENIID0001_142950 [Sergentomyia squamirostris]
MMRPDNVDKSCGKPQNRLKYVRNNMKRQKEPTTRADSPPSPTKPSTSVTVSRRIVFSSPSKCVSHTLYANSSDSNETTIRKPRVSPRGRMKRLGTIVLFPEFILKKFNKFF